MYYIFKNKAPTVACRLFASGFKAVCGVVCAFVSRELVRMLTFTKSYRYAFPSLCSLTTLYWIELKNLLFVLPQAKSKRRLVMLAQEQLFELAQLTPMTHQSRSMCRPL